MEDSIRMKKSEKLSRKAKQDESIMNTNNSCIVSKRSVEKIYHHRDDGLRYFVKKFQRRSPLINRGYWLRMRAIEQVILSFLRDDVSSRPKAIVNLGCGYDTIPFKLLSEHTDACNNATFVDVDYPDLMRKKCDIIKSTPQLFKNLGYIDDAATPATNVMLLTKPYVAVGCDLTDVGSLHENLKMRLRIAEHSVLFVAEVSMTYMDVDTADKVISWASTFENGQFCLLEQCLPDGPDTPFATTMLNHFKKLHSPLKPLLQYPRPVDEEDRFRKNGWPAASARTLWDLWNDDAFLPAEEATAFDKIEPFDEWEEFALFASHYFLLIASTKAADSGILLGHSSEDDASCNLLLVAYNAYPQGLGQRRYGAAFRSGPSLLTHQGGHGTQGRLSNADLFGLKRDVKCPIEDITLRKASKTNLPELMCHTITCLDDRSSFLVGGRASPGRASANCYLRAGMSWTRAEDLPLSRYRHCAALTRLGHDDKAKGVLIFGGKSSLGQVLGEWLLWQSHQGWRSVKADTPSPESRFGASMCSWGDSGYLAGGMTDRGCILQDVWAWSLKSDGSGSLTISFSDLTSKLRMTGAIRAVLGRFGASLIATTSSAFLVGGVSPKSIARQHDLLRIDNDLTVTGITLGPDFSQPLLVGHAVEVMHVRGKEILVILGGGAVCFSFGTFWNQGCYCLSTEEHESQLESLAILQPKEPASGSQANGGDENGLSIRDGDGGTGHGYDQVPVQNQQYPTATDFEAILAIAQPVVLKGLDLGPCIHTWTAEYLVEKLGPDRQVVVHDSPTPTMDFFSKNFRYTTLPFSTFISRIQNGSYLYLRALSASNPADKPTHLHQDFPTLSPDFILPPSLAIVSTRTHSSPLRVSGPTTIWLHYDVQSNIYAQIRGRKRLALFPPSVVASLAFPAAASSSPLHVFNADGTVRKSLRRLRPHIADLGPGDVVFIPACWPHSTFPLDRFSVAVNVFFAEPGMDKAYASGRDVYGNRDLSAYESGRRDLKRIVRAFGNVPQDTSGFYLRRLAEELVAAAEEAEQQQQPDDLTT